MFYTQLQNALKPGIVLYEVYAVTDPQFDNVPSKAVLIANLTLTTTVTTSQWGDRHMFSQHRRMEADLKLKPEWAGPAKAVQDAQRNAKDQILYDDIAWN